jgi:hypothetical protein
MAKPEKDEIQGVRLIRIAKHVSHPRGWLLIHYRLFDDNGHDQPEEFAMRAIMTADEARQIASHLSLLAKEIDAAGGSRH